MPISFEDIMRLNGCDATSKDGLYVCPICNERTFQVFCEPKAKCHSTACSWEGDGIMLNADINGISYEESKAMIVKAYTSGSVGIKSCKIGE